MSKKSEWKPTDPVYFEVRVYMPVKFQPEDGGNTLEALGELMDDNRADLIEACKMELDAFAEGFCFDKVYSDQNMTEEIGDWDSVM